MKYLLILSLLILPGCMSIDANHLAEISCEAGYVMAIVDYKEDIPKEKRQKIKDNELYRSRCREELGKALR